MDYNTLIQSKQFRLKELLRQYNIIGPPTVANFRKGYQKYGNAFMQKMVDILNDPEFSNFEEVPAPAAAGYTPTATGTTAGSGKFWTFMDNLFSTVAKGSETYAKAYSDVTGTPSVDMIRAQAALEAQRNNQSKTVMYVAGAALLVLLVIIVVKK